VTVAAAVVVSRESVAPAMIPSKPVANNIAPSPCEPDGKGIFEFQNPGIGIRSRDLRVQNPGTTPFFSRIFVPGTTKQLKHHDFGRDAQFSLTYGRMYLVLVVCRICRLWLMLK
jgi:hypothetical protein